MIPENALLVRTMAWRRAGRADLAGDLVHAVSQPLSCIRGFAEALQLVARDGRAFAADHIAERMQRIITETDAIDALLQEARSADRTPGSQAPDPAQAVEAVMRFQGRRLQAHGVRCQITRSGPEVRTSLPSEHLQEIIRILLTNAQEACRRRHGRGGSIAIAIDAIGDPVVLTIADDGCGMEAETLARAGEPGFTTRPDGAGLGLAVARALLSAWTGSLALASTPGIGTTATVRLSLARTP